jgi:uncharacterized protein with FMN-binding domain
LAPVDVLPEQACGIFFIFLASYLMKKKVLLSFLIVVSFIGYAILQGITKVGGLLGAAAPRPDGQLSNGQPANKLAANPAPVNQIPVAPPPVSNSAGSQPAPSQSNNAGQTGPVIGGGSSNIPLRGGYKDGQYVGNSVDVFYGNVQVKAIISAGKIIDVQFLDYPQDRRTSQEIAAMSLPTLRSEAISSQSAQVDIVSGATETSRGFIQSLGSALAQAQA